VAPYDDRVHLTPILAAVCTVMSVAFVWPGVIRIYRLASVQGIPARGTLHGVASSVLWSIYGLFTHVVAVSLSNALVLAALVLIAIAQIRFGAMPRSWLVGVVAGVAAVAIVTGMVSPTITGWLAIAVGGTSVIPQALHVLRVADLGGVSVTMYGLLTLTAVCWGVYGVLIHNFLVTAPNLIVFPCAVLVAVKATTAQWRDRRPAPLPTAN